MPKEVDFSLRPMAPHDFPALLALFQEFATFQRTPEYMVNSLERMEAEQDLINGFVAVNPAGEILGYASYFLAYTTWVGKSMYLDDLYVREAHRKLGLGKALIDRVIEEAKVQKCHRLKWQVSRWNENAQEFYRQLGAIIDDVEINCKLNLD
ncbi:MAG TPA: GNAT family N-acetyltransferase [Cytophagales bacterium]|nr:GNAT family N-acetyltransferase [Cytophagales bacterium]HAA18464.1 GNAT family N-acetyltransferase [Cytophagales bacterium]HAP61064.1 GNAT family N-acetyltransferase [Cytophagales bacterium]